MGNQDPFQCASCYRSESKISDQTRNMWATALSRLKWPFFVLNPEPGSHKVSAGLLATLARAVHA